MTEPKSDDTILGERVCFSCGKNLKNKDSLIRICPDCLDHSDFTPKITDWAELHKEIDEIWITLPLKAEDNIKEILYIK